MVVIVSINKNTSFKLCKVMKYNNIYLVQLLYNSMRPPPPPAWSFSRKSITEKNVAHTHIYNKTTNFKQSEINPLTTTSS